MKKKIEDYSSVDSMSDCRVSGFKFKSQLVCKHFMGIYHEVIMSTVILPILLIQVGSMCTKYWLTTLRFKPAQEKVSRLTDRLNMTLPLLTGLKTPNQTTKKIT